MFEKMPDYPSEIIYGLIALKFLKIFHQNWIDSAKQKIDLIKELTN